MPDAERIVLHLGFRGGEVLVVRAPAADADALEAALRAGTEGVAELDAEDGRLLVVLSKVSYVKRYAREGRVGFAS